MKDNYSSLANVLVMSGDMEGIYLTYVCIYIYTIFYYTVTSVLVANFERPSFEFGVSIFKTKTFIQ